MNQCIGSAMEWVPPLISWAPNPFSILDTGIALQSFVPNVQGCLDNLAHAWLREKGLTGEGGTPFASSRVGCGPGNAAVPHGDPEDPCRPAGNFDIPSGSFERT